MRTNKYKLSSLVFACRHLNDKISAVLQQLNFMQNTLFEIVPTLSQQKIFSNISHMHRNLNLIFLCNKTYPTVLF